MVRGPRQMIEPASRAWKVGKTLRGSNRGRTLPGWRAKDKLIHGANLRAVSSPGAVQHPPGYRLREGWSAPFLPSTTPVKRPKVQSEDQARDLQPQIDDDSPGDLDIPAALWTRKAVRHLIRKQYGIDMPVRNCRRVPQAVGRHGQGAASPRKDETPRRSARGWI